MRLQHTEAFCKVFQGGVWRGTFRLSGERGGIGDASAFPVSDVSLRIQRSKRIRFALAGQSVTIILEYNNSQPFSGRHRQLTKSHKRAL